MYDFTLFDCITAEMKFIFREGAMNLLESSSPSTYFASLNMELYFFENYLLLTESGFKFEVQCSGQYIYFYACNLTLQYFLSLKLISCVDL